MSGVFRDFSTSLDTVDHCILPSIIRIASTGLQALYLG